MKHKAIITSLLMFFGISGGAQQLPFQNPNLTPEERAADLVSALP